MILCLCAAIAAPVTEPFPPFTEFNATGSPPAPHSEDPQVRYTWAPTVDASELQLYRAAPASISAHPPSSFSGVAAANAAGGSLDIGVLAPGYLRLDFGEERAAWLEFASADLAALLDGDRAVVAGVRASVSEYDFPWQGKTRAPVRYNGTAGSPAAPTNTFRLEPNAQLYEGLRYAWIFFDPPRGAPAAAVEAAGPTPRRAPAAAAAVTPLARLAGIAAVSRAKPLSYAGAFNSSDETLARSWYTGAYGVRLNMNGGDFGSILMERGDRVSIQGDGHPTMAASLVAFGSSVPGQGAFPLVKEMLNKTDSGCKGCHVVDDSLMSYPVLWCMSVLDYFWASGDGATLDRLAPDMQHILDNAVKSFGRNPPVAFMGWDDRLANGFCGVGNTEVQLAFAALAARAVGDFARALAALPGSAFPSKQLAPRYNATAAQLVAALRQGAAGPHPNSTSVPWHDAYGIHAAANAVNAGVATAAEQRLLFDRHFNDSTTACSWSPFNQYWLLQGLGNMGQMETALASVRLCWGTQLPPPGHGGCFNELWNPEWATLYPPGSGDKVSVPKLPTRPSMCHPWSSGVTHWLSQRVLGVTPLAPGFARFLAMPHLELPSVPVAGGGGYDEAAAVAAVGGRVPTPHGPIEVKASAAPLGALRTGQGIGRDVTIDIVAPAPGRVALPLLDAGGCALAPRSAAVALHGAARATPLRLSPAAALPEHVLGARGEPTVGGAVAPAVASAHLFSELLPAGSHRVTARYAVPAGATSCAVFRAAPPPESWSFPPYPPPTYPAAVSAPMDAGTRGDWVGKYGADGFALLAFDGSNASAPRDVTRLPPYVLSLTQFKSNGKKGTFYGADAQNVTYLQPPPSSQQQQQQQQQQQAPWGGLPRALGSYGEGCADGCQGTVFDLNVSHAAAGHSGGTNGTAVPAHMYVSLYMVDQQTRWGGDDSPIPHTGEQVIRALDLRTMSPVAPESLSRVARYRDGVYWTLRLQTAVGAPGSTGVRLRIMPVYGNARVSAIFFDSEEPLAIHGKNS